MEVLETITSLPWPFYKITIFESFYWNFLLGIAYSFNELFWPWTGSPNILGLGSWIHQNLTISEHKKFWHTLESCQQAKLYLRTPFAAEHFNKSKLRFLVGAISGYFECNKHLHSLGLSHSTLYDRCESDIGSMYHILCLCPTLSQRRIQFFDHPWLSLSKWLLFLHFGQSVHNGPLRSSYLRSSIYICGLFLFNRPCISIYLSIYLAYSSYIEQYHVFFLRNFLEII